MENFSLDFSVVIGLIFLICFGIFTLLLFWKNEKLSRLSQELYRLKESFNELDEQAKLIVKTDLDLNKTQEELNRKLNGLDVLQKVSGLISTTLDEKEIFRRLDQALISKELGFEKYLILTFDENKKLQCRAGAGIPEDALKELLLFLSNDETVRGALNKSRSYSSLYAADNKKAAVGRLLNVAHFIFSPILSQNGVTGVVFLGSRSNASPITPGDEEVISILANQIGQTLENARLFEQVFRSTQILEKKVQDRTKELASALSKVQEISRAKSEFISAVSHELRTPLTSIKGYAALLMTGKLGSIPQTVKERLEKINIHSDNLVKLINDLLDISRIESGRMEMNFKNCRLAEIIEGVCDLLTPQMKEKNLRWVSQVPENIPEILLDRGQIERVFINLIGNAIKFTPPEGTITIRVELSAPPKNGSTDQFQPMVKIEISDTGIGIALEDIPKLFNEFFRIENPINQMVKGTGLGLVLAKKIVEAHKGKIWVTSRLKAGTTFHFMIPLVSPLLNDAKR